MPPHSTFSASKPPAPSLDLTFNDALQYLELQTYPPAPDLHLTGEPQVTKNDVPKNESSSFDFAPLWKYFEEASGCKSAEERLGKDSWVLKYRSEAIPKCEVRAVKEENSPATRLSEEDTVVAEDSNLDAESIDSLDEDIKPPRPSFVVENSNLDAESADSLEEDIKLSRSSFVAPATSLKNTTLVPSIVTRKTITNCPKPPAPSGALPSFRQISTSQALPRKPATPLLVPTDRKVYTTTNFNAIPAPYIPSHGIIYPVTYETHLEKKQKIVRKLHQNLAQVDPDICQILGISPSPSHPLVRPAGEQGGLHIFIDISNIVFGFINCLRVARGVPYGKHVSQPPFNFTDFAFILERGRRITRRVVVGSCAKYTKMPYHIEATSRGYEVNLLERVSKARLPKGKRVESASGYASTSEGPVTGSALANVEQGVDEILQMKMLESLVDTDVPSTIILATGDAAVAEFSGGFLVNVKRALLKGWNVEIVGWRANMSSAFVKLAKKMAKQESLRGMLKIIFLDDMAEDLLAWYRPE